MLVRQRAFPHPTAPVSQVIYPHPVSPTPLHLHKRYRGHGGLVLVRQGSPISGSYKATSQRQAAKKRKRTKQPFISGKVGTPLDRIKTLI
jgi:hypothetical protein